MAFQLALEKAGLVPDADALDEPEEQGHGLCSGPFFGIRPACDPVSKLRPIEAAFARTSSGDLNATPGRSGSRKRLNPSALGAALESATAQSQPPPTGQHAAAVKPQQSTPDGPSPCDAGDSGRGGLQSSRPAPGHAGGVSGGATAPGSRTGGAPGSARDRASGAARPGNGSSPDWSGGAAAQCQQAQQELEDDDDADDGRPQQRLRSYCGASTLAAGPAPVEGEAGAGAEAAAAWAAHVGGGTAGPTAAYAEKRSGSGHGMGAGSSGPLKALLLRLFDEQPQQLEFERQHEDEQAEGRGEQPLPGHQVPAGHLGHPHKQSHAREQAQPHPPHQPHPQAHHYRQQQPQPCVAKAAEPQGAWDLRSVVAVDMDALLAPPPLHGHQHQQLQHEPRMLQLQQEHGGEGPGWLLDTQRHKVQLGEVPILAPAAAAAQLQDEGDQHARTDAHFFAPAPLLQRPAATVTATGTLTATATTAASIYGGLYSSGHAHISSSNAPYSELLSGPGFSYGATEAGEFLKADDAILFGSDDEREGAAGEGGGSVRFGAAARDHSGAAAAAADGSGGAGSGAGGGRRADFMIDAMLDAAAEVAEAQGPQTGAAGAQAVDSAPVEGVGSVPASGPGDAHIWSAGTAGSGSGGRADDVGGAVMAAFLAASGMPQQAKAGGGRPVPRMPSWLPPAVFEARQGQGEQNQNEQDARQAPPAPAHVQTPAPAVQHGSKATAAPPGHAGHAGGASAAREGAYRYHKLQPLAEEVGNEEAVAGGGGLLLRTGSSDTVLANPDAQQPASRRAAAPTGATHSTGSGSDDDSSYTDTGDLSTEDANRLHSYVIESVGSAQGAAGAAARAAGALLGPPGVAAAQQQQHAGPVGSGEGGTGAVAEAAAAGAAALASGQGECFVAENDAQEGGGRAPQDAAVEMAAAEAAAGEAAGNGADPMAIGSGPGGSYAASVMQQRQQEQLPQSQQQQLQQFQQQQQQLYFMQEQRRSMEVDMGEPPELQAQAVAPQAMMMGPAGLGATTGAAVAMAAAVEAAAAASTARAAAAAATEAAAAAAAAAMAHGPFAHGVLSLQQAPALAGIGMPLPAGAFGLDAYPAVAVGPAMGPPGGVTGLPPLQTPVPGAMAMAAELAAAAGAEPAASGGAALLPGFRSDARSPIAAQQPSATAGTLAAAAPVGAGTQSMAVADAPLPQLLAPDVYMGFVGQLVASVHNATRAAAAAAFRHAGPGLGGSNAAIVAAAAAAAQAAYRHGHPTVAAAIACYGNNGTHNASAAPHYVQQHQPQMAMPPLQQQEPCGAGGDAVPVSAAVVAVWRRRS
ncbi:hypothetical protein HXX76_003367 [Chlamydomonas incerta]|uniref:Uncharacterized protein n=1 Tax=Chlamydomonas incerta TaxID=51695 RepID=A0A835TJQ6_CHLIN|nr:hypothetical protein HXX76_003367 [Chlamydomonas incerta]|eukprot:KAG2441754.1 hypothetical protein HXX76_003367 [Chlamydomonas incerta]